MKKHFTSTLEISDQMNTEEYLNEGEIYPWFAFCINLPRYAAMNALFNCVFMMSLAMFFLQTYLFLVNFNVKYFVQYSPVYLATVYIMIALAVYIKCYKVFSPHIKRFKHTIYWSVNMASDKTQTIIWSDHRRVRWTYCTQLLIALICTGLNAYVFSKDHEHYAAFSPFIINNFPKYSNYIHYCFIPIISLACFPMIVAFWYIFYLLLYFKIQIYMLIDKFSFLNLDNVYLKNKFLSKDYNEKVKRFLVFCLKRHGRIIGYLHFITENGEVLTLLFIIGTLFISTFTVCAVFFFVTGLGVAVLCTFVYFMCLVSICYEFQLLHDSVYDLSEAFYNLNWYTWNSENMKIYKTIHLNISLGKLILPIPSFINSNLAALKSLCMQCIVISTMFINVKIQMGGISKQFCIKFFCNMWKNNIKFGI